MPRKQRKSAGTETITVVNTVPRIPASTRITPVRQQGPRRIRRRRAQLNDVSRTMGMTMEEFRNLTVQAEHMPQTQAGLAWLRDVLNPCGEDPLPELQGIPDGSGTDSVVLKLRDDLLVAAPTLVSNDWSMVIFSTPYLMSQLIIIRYDGNVPPSQTVLRQVLNGMTQATWDGPARYPNFFTPTFMLPPTTGVLIPVTGPAFDISILVPASLRDSFDSSQNAVGWTYFRKWRTISKGHTIHLNAPDLANEGRVISAASATESSVKTVSVSGGGGPAGAVQDIALRFTVSPPYEDNILAQQDTNARQDVIKKGEYIQQRLWNKVQVWNEAEDVRGIYRALDAAIAGFNDNLPGPEYIKRDGFDMNLGWFVENIRGLSPAAEVHIKHRVKIEFNVPGSSPWAPFSRPSPPEDEGALNLYYCLASKLPHAYDSAFNDWGLLSGMILKCIGQIGAPLLRQAVGQGTRLIHNMLDVGMQRVDKSLAKYSTMTGSTGYGDRGYT